MIPLIRWVRFNLVGAVGMVVQLAALSLFNRLLHGRYLIASAAALELTVLHNFVWHTQYTWRDRRSGFPAGSNCYASICRTVSCHWLETWRSCACWSAQCTCRSSQPTPSPSCAVRRQTSGSAIVGRSLHHGTLRPRLSRPFARRSAVRCLRFHSLHS